MPTLLEKYMELDNLQHENISNTITLVDQARQTAAISDISNLSAVAEMTKNRVDQLRLGMAEEKEETPDSLVFFSWVSYLCSLLNLLIIVAALSLGYKLSMRAFGGTNATG